MIQWWTLKLRRTKGYVQGHSAVEQQNQDSNPGPQTLPGHGIVHSTVRTPFMQMQGYKMGVTDGISKTTEACDCLG